MPRQTRHITEFKGVYFVKLSNGNKSFFIRYKRNGKSVEERAGRSNEGVNAEKAQHLRTERISGIEFKDRINKYISNLSAIQYWTFSKIFENYLHLRPDLKGRENDIYRFKKYLELDFADISPEAVTHGDVERFRHNLQNKHLKPATVRHILELLRRLSNFAVKKNYCSGLSFKIEMPKVENQKTETLTHDQLHKLIRALDEDPDLQVSNLVRMVLYTGMRRGELFELCWSDIDFYNKIITVRSAKNGQHPTIPLNEMAEKVLAEHAHFEGSSKFTFPGRGGTKRTECKRSLLRIRKKAGLPDDFRLLQGLRHVYATMLVSSGKVDLETLQSLLTQKSSLMTQRYAHLLDQAEDFTGTQIATDRTDSEIFSNNVDTKMVTDYEVNSDTKPLVDITKPVIASNYTDVEENEEARALEIDSNYTYFEKTKEASACEIATYYSENIDTEPVAKITDTVLASDYTVVEEAEEVPAIEILKNYTDRELSTDSTHNLESKETPEIEKARYSIYMDESAEIADDLIARNNMDSKSNEEFKHKVKIQYFSDITIAAECMNSKQQYELEGTESETKKPEFSQLVKKNYTTFKPTEIHQRQVYSSKNIVVDNKVANYGKEKSAQQKARPSLKNLKNDLKSLSQLIQSAPRRSKITTAKRNLN